MEKSITKNIVKVMNIIYIKLLHSRNTNKIQANASTILECLFLTYSAIEPELLIEHKLKVRQIMYNTMEYLLLFCDEVEELGHLDHIAQNPYSM